MANRNTLTSATVGAVTGDAYMDNVSDHIAQFYDASVLPLSAVGGSANVVTATVDPTLPGNIVKTGMKFTITWALANTGGVTLSLNAGPARAVLDAAGNALTTGALKSGSRSLLEFVGTAYRVIGGSNTGAGGAADPVFQAFTVSGTWAKPTGYADDHMVLIEAWGGGGSGNSHLSGGSGGGGGYMMRRMRYADIPSSVTVTIGAGGVTNSGTSSPAGGNTTFGSLVIAYGGGGGGNAGGSGSGGGGSGGGTLEAGASGSGATPGVSAKVGGGAQTKTGTIEYNADAKNIFAGGGGAVSISGYSGGGNAVFGGGGGASDTIAPRNVAGQSTFGGAGGANGVTGTAPGGGGGRGASGARGEVRIWL